MSGDEQTSTEGLLKVLLREFKGWYDAGTEKPPDSLINARNELMRRIVQMETDHRAMEKLRQDNPEATWSYARGTLFKGYAPAQVLSDLSRSQTARDPARAILGEGESGEGR